VPRAPVCSVCWLLFYLFSYGHCIVWLITTLVSSNISYQYWDTCHIWLTNIDTCHIWLTNIETHVTPGWILRMSTISCLGDRMTFSSPGQYSHVMQVLFSLRFEVCKLFTFQFFTKPLDTIKPKRTEILLNGQLQIWYFHIIWKTNTFFLYVHDHWVYNINLTIWCYVRVAFLLEIFN
jgi:hypothetical protein